MGRWRYDSVYKDSSPLRVAPSSAANAGGAPVDKNAGSESLTTLPPTAKPNVDPSVRKHVMWFEDSQAYGLNATYDYRFKLRHAPIPRTGTPWPMPQSYLPSNISHLVNSDLSLTVAGSSCPILHINFKRIRRNIFGACEEDSSGPNVFQMFGANIVRSVSVNVEKRCTKYPYLEMDESCELFCLIFYLLWHFVGMEIFLCKICCRRCHCLDNYLRKDKVSRIGWWCKMQL